jgi:hypothetical protein
LGFLKCKSKIGNAPLEALHAVVKRKNLDLGAILDVGAGVHAAVAEME